MTSALDELLAEQKPAAPGPLAVSAGFSFVPEAEYHLDPCPEPSLSSSVARILCSQSPIHAWAAHPRLNPDYQPEEAAHFDLGTAAHDLLLRGVESVAVLDFADWRTNAAKDARDAARAEGKVPLLADQWERVQAMVQAARIQLDGLGNPPLFADGEPEMTMTWQEANGVWCRVRLDWLHESRRFVDDYKTTGRSANPDEWSRTLFNVGYDVQAAFYLRGLAALGHQATFRFCVQETAAPYALSVVSLSDSALDLARSKVDYAIRTFGDCLRKGVWPGYSRAVAVAMAPSWEQLRWADIQADLEAAQA